VFFVLAKIAVALIFCFSISRTVIPEYFARALLLASTFRHIKMLRQCQTAACAASDRSTFCSAFPCQHLQISRPGSGHLLHVLPYSIKRNNCPQNLRPCAIRLAFNAIKCCRAVNENWVCRTFPKRPLSGLWWTETSAGELSQKHGCLLIAAR
jgi:hypothetical protein